MSGKPPNTIESLRERVEIQPYGCWEWTGRCNSKGYGRASWRGKEVRVHRIFFEHFKGPIPDGMHICHHCDNPPCCNPKHLFAGTAADNEWNKIDKRHRRRRLEKVGSVPQLDLLRFSLRHYGTKKTRVSPFKSTIYSKLRG